MAIQSFNYSENAPNEWPTRLCLNSEEGRNPTISRIAPRLRGREIVALYRLEYIIVFYCIFYNGSHIGHFSSHAREGWTCAKKGLDSKGYPAWTAHDERALECQFVSLIFNQNKRMILQAHRFYEMPWNEPPQSTCRGTLITDSRYRSLPKLTSSRCSQLKGCHFHSI